VVKKAQQCLFNLRRLKKFVMAPKTLTNCYRCTIKSFLSGCITAWYGNCTTLNCMALQKVVRSAQLITWGTLPAFQDIYSTRCHRKAKKLIKDLSHPSNSLFTLLIEQTATGVSKTGTERLKNSFYLQTITHLNSHHQQATARYSARHLRDCCPMYIETLNTGHLNNVYILFDFICIQCSEKYLTLF
jgi:hypothetical protein